MPRPGASARLAAGLLACLGAAAGNVIVVPRGALQDLRTPPAGAGAAGIAPPRTLMLYDCKADYLDWVRSWSTTKQQYCCQRSGMNCQKASLRQQEQFGPDVGYDCEEGYGNWQVEWSAGKSDWCCKGLGRGCVAPVRDLLVQPGPPPAEPPTVAPERSTEKGYTADDFDCSAGSGDLSQFWSQYKKDYCCRLKGIACLNVAV